MFITPLTAGSYRREMKEEIEPISPIIDYPINSKGELVTRRGDIARMKPKLDAPPANQIGSVDWTMNHLFGSRDKAIEMIESLVAGQGENADEKWLRFILLYRKWELEGLRPTLNEVCHSLNFDASVFLRELQGGIQQMMRGISHLRASLEAPAIVDNLTKKASSEEADVKEIELALRIGGVIESGPGVNVQINNTQQTAIMLKGDKEKLKAPLLQFNQTVTAIDDEVRKEQDDI